jgi:DNA repair exonuclease SbcCD ATPase subunit
MIRTLQLKCFRKHVDLNIEFSSGLNVLRGANEAGKSTVLEAALYALYGAKALRNSLAETVTWGHKESELSVFLEIEINGTRYSFSRSKAGAVCRYQPDIRADAKVHELAVTGQQEVSAFAAEILGADVKTASVLMLSSQSGLRGALDDGPTAVSGLMSKLADFDLIDRILDNAGKKLLLGNEAPVRGKIDAAEAEIGMATDALPLSDEIPHARAKVDAKQTELDGMIKEVNEVHAPAADAALQAYSEAKALNEKYEQKEDNIKRTLVSIRSLTAHIEADQKIVEAAPAPERLGEARRHIEEASLHSARLEAYTKVGGLPPYPEVFWEGPVSDFNKEVERLGKEHTRIETQITAERRALTLIRSELMDPKQGKCRVCGTVLQTAEQIEAHNAGVQAKITAKETEIAVLIQQSSAAAGEVAALQAVLTSAKPFVKVADALRNLNWPVTIEENVYPPRISWTGEVPVAPTSVEILQRNLRTLEHQVRDAQQAQGRIDANRASCADLQQQVERMQAELAQMALVDLEPLDKDYQEAVSRHKGMHTLIEIARSDLKGLQETLTTKERAHTEAWNRLTTARQRLSEYRTDLTALQFNNTLVKKLKALKPTITDSLWNTVLAAVSNFFSQLRGEQSVVSKDSDGFKVNGQSVDSLSGSTLDVLALAIRVALTKTFVPHAGFMVLDEPAHGCDTTRTGNVLGFLAAVGFTQTLLASHDELSEAVADKVVLLGE